jgi:hypothetical protein
MMTGKLSIQKTLFFSAILLISTTAFAQPPVVVKTYGQHVGGNIVYIQEVSNTGDRKILDIDIGLDTDYVSPNLPYNRAMGELTVFPVGSDVFNMAIRPESVSGPSGWTAQLIQIEDSGQYFVWRGPAYPVPAILPGQTATFRIVVPKYDAVYLTGHFTAHYAGGKEPWAYNGVMEKLDTTPPTISLTVSPIRLNVTAGKLVTVTATLTTKDDYDPQPEIKLESITANEPLAAGDVVGAATGTDDRQFQLRDVKAPKGSAGRIYTITYSATDASGNKATASATVSVK